ncbi:uncharacterized protein EV420DRAFT_1485438 [Desarmillaria tabescens]|uniref:Uncharacterized protein n=1 Tax=Armillaria tabescens TaxID=1929756 RepID=A0AA39JG33_ARMTA|nr:uncharacterized protein EV420DRAFT_1485438 [Desarmillaria tabescens]KAK0441998.1 hypothetical protein EV420DRAFT_1485438 [Desarmillaria tabescens]
MGRSLKQFADRYWCEPEKACINEISTTEDQFGAILDTIILAKIREPLEQWTMKLNELYTSLGAYRNRSMPSPWATNQQENVYHNICLLVNNQKDESIKTYTNALSWQKLSFVKVGGRLASYGKPELLQRIEEMLWRCIIGVAWGCWTSDTGLTNFLTEAAPLIQGDSEGVDTWFSDAFAALVQCNQILGLEVHRLLTLQVEQWGHRHFPALWPHPPNTGLNINDLPTIELGQIGEDGSLFV